MEDFLNVIKRDAKALIKTKDISVKILDYFININQK